ncbi:MAG: sugar ABC transporter ATP-binding protein, partial [Oscillospiraceae bacterium]
RVISRPLKVLVLDEPTAPLTVAEVDILFDIIAKLKAQGLTIIYISHRIEEIFSVSDRVSVLRDGCYIGTVKTSEIDRPGLISMMIGKDVRSDCPPPISKVGDEVVLEAENVTGNGVHNISFKLKKGEILGFAGLVGCGRTELMSVIFGDTPLREGRIFIKGKVRKFKTCRHAIKAGLGLVPEDRKAAGLLMENSVRVNISLASMKKLSRFTVIDKKAELKVVDRYAKALQIKTPSYEQQVEKLSGGNQQKVVVARWLVSDSDILIFDEPTRGIDVAAKQEIYKLMRELAAEGKSILMVSSDMEELLGMSDRIVVLSEGQLAGELTREEFDTHRILDMASGER